MGGMGMETPSPSQLGKVPLSAEQYQSLRWEREIEERNRFLSDEELDSMLPPDGYKVQILWFMFMHSVIHAWAGLREVLPKVLGEVTLGMWICARLHFVRKSMPTEVLLQRTGSISPFQAGRCYTCYSFRQGWDVRVLGMHGLVEYPNQPPSERFRISHGLQGRPLDWVGGLLLIVDSKIRGVFGHSISDQFFLTCVWRLCILT